MNNHPQVAARVSPWKFRIRIVTLITLLTLGVGIAAIERWRQEAFDQVWGVVHEQLTLFLTPISERTNRIFTVISKIDRLLKVEEDNKRLLRENSMLNVANQRLSEEMGRLGRLAGLGRWSGPSDLSFVSADIAGLITSGQSAALIINRGRDDGVRRQDPVVALGGLVGIVQSISSNTARVQTLLDPASAVGVMDRDSRARGVLFGPRDNNNKMLEFMPENEVQPINIGGTLITSGFENSVYPKGIIVGTIQERKLNTYGIPYGIVKPAVSFEAIEEVLLVLPSSRLAGRENTATTLTLGSRRIYMPGSLPAVYISNAWTTESASPGTHPILNDVAVTSASSRDDTAATTATLTLPVSDDHSGTTTAAVTSNAIINQPLPLKYLEPKRARDLAKAAAEANKKSGARAPDKKSAAEEKKSAPTRKGRVPGGGAGAESESQYGF